jgi:hypothetical protein
LKVHSILEDKNDLAACVYPRLDIRGKGCALLKVRIIGQGVILERVMWAMLSKKVTNICFMYQKDMKT